MYNHAPCHFIQSHIRKVRAYLAVTWHLHVWQNDRGLLRATAVTRGGTDTEISQHRKLTLEKKILPPLLQEFEPATFRSRVRRSTTELSPLLLSFGEMTHISVRTRRSYTPIKVAKLCILHNGLTVPLASDFSFFLSFPINAFVPAGCGSLDDSVHHDYVCSIDIYIAYMILFITIMYVA